MSLKRTALFERHVALGGKLIQFAGWEMPVQYSGIIAEHNGVRTAAGLFDLGHMGQVDVQGPDALEFLQYTTSNDISRLKPGEAIYGLLTNPNGGVVDDIITYRYPDGEPGYFVCINGANVEKDVNWWLGQVKLRPDLDVQVRNLSDELGMIAIQGPKAEAIASKITDADLPSIDYFSWQSGIVAGVETRIARTGYTGEDGFEFYAPNEHIHKIWDALLEAGKDDGIQPVGLGARDTLRLESRMPLYGQELSDEINPYEAGLGWAVALDKGDFVGRDRIASVKESGPARRTVGFKTVGRAPAPRTHYEVQVDGQTIGEVTSGAFSPTLGENIGLAIIDREYAGVGKPLQIIVRNKPVEAVQVKTPFYKRER